MLQLCEAADEAEAGSYPCLILRTSEPIPPRTPWLMVNVRMSVLNWDFQNQYFDIKSLIQTKNYHILPLFYMLKVCQMASFQQAINLGFHQGHKMIPHKKIKEVHLWENSWFPLLLILVFLCSPLRLSGIVRGKKWVISHLMLVLSNGYVLYGYSEP